MRPHLAGLRGGDHRRPNHPVYSCPECIVRAIFMGQKLEFPLTFVIGPDGKPMDPANPDGEIDLTAYD